MKKKTIVKIIILVIIILTATLLYFTGTYDSLKVKAINFFEEKLNRHSLELITGKGSLIDKATLSSLEDSGVNGSNYSFNSIDNAYYRILEEDEKELYKQIYANIIEVKKNFKPVIKINKDKLSDIVEAVFNDNPNLFWVNTNYSYKYIEEGQVVQITLTYNYTSKNLEESKALFEEKANQIVQEASLYTDDYYKEKYVHDTLIKMNKYDEKEKLNQSAYSALVKGKTVCAGYSRAFMYIMNKLGIRTYYITGDSNGEHSWNIVELENEYYNVDLTWDAQKKISYRYFNVPDSVFTKTHIRKDLSIYLPVCRGNKYYNYETKIIEKTKPNGEKEYENIKPSKEPEEKQEREKEIDGELKEDIYNYYNEDYDVYNYE